MAKSFYAYKQASGIYRWVAVWSNAYRDRDFPPEILAEAAQIDFAKAVNDGSWPYPELWLYHIQGSRSGISDFIAYDADNKLSLASGVFDAGKELVAEALISTPVELKTSHGFPRTEVRRDSDDPTIITRFRTKEISPLPAMAAANEVTGFVILGGKMNLVPEIVKEKLSAIFPSDQVEKIASALDEMGDEAKEANLEFKEAKDTEAKDAEAKSTEVDTEVKVKAETKVEAKEQEIEPVSEPEGDEPLNRKEVEDAIKAVSAALSTLTSAIETLDTSQTGTVDELKAFSERLDALEKTDEEKMAQLAAETPSASRTSFAEMIQMSVIGKEVTHVDGRKARHEGPEETKNTMVNTGHAVMDNVITDIINSRENAFGVQGGQ